MIGFLIPYIDWSLVLGMTSLGMICSGAWAQNKREERDEQAKAEKLDQRLADLRHDIGSLELQVATLEGIVQ